MLRSNGSRGKCPRGKARSLRPPRRRFPQTGAPAAPRKKCVGKARRRGLPERAQINRNSHFIFRTENGGGQRSSSPVSVIAAKKDGRGFLQFFRNWHGTGLTVGERSDFCLSLSGAAPARERSRHRPEPPGSTGIPPAWYRFCPPAGARRCTAAGSRPDRR